MGSKLIDVFSYNWSLPGDFFATGNDGNDFINRYVLINVLIFINGIALDVCTAPVFITVSIM